MSKNSKGKWITNRPKNTRRRFYEDETESDYTVYTDESDESNNLPPIPIDFCSQMFCSSPLDCVSFRYFHTRITFFHYSYEGLSGGLPLDPF